MRFLIPVVQWTLSVPITKLLVVVKFLMTLMVWTQRPHFAAADRGTHPRGEGACNCRPLPEAR